MSYTLYANGRGPDFCHYIAYREYIYDRFHRLGKLSAFGSTTVYFDSTTGNQDPYVWNEAFLHSYCHITQFHAEPGDLNLWVSGDRFPEFSHLYCDLVFSVARKCPWADGQ